MIHIYIYAVNRLWDTDRISRLRRPPLKRRAITHFGEKHVKLGAGWVVGKPEVTHPQSVHDQTVSLQGFTPGAPAFCERRQDISPETTLRQTFSRRMNHMSGS